MIGKIRPQIFLALLLLGVIAVLGIFEALNEVTVGCIAGIIALSKDVLQSDA
jgi:ABC-type Na+ efflux pump permease subunit